MLWDLIRDFFVIHVFGGYTSEYVAYSGFLGQVASEDANYDQLYLSSLYMPIKAFNGLDDWAVSYISFSDWLSTTATIISITIIVVLCCLFVYKIIRLIGGLIR